MKSILRLDSALSFGKHKGKTVKQIFCGVRPIPSDAMAEMYFVWRGKPMSDGHDEHILDGWIDDKLLNEVMPEGQRLLLHYQPHSSYIDWLIQHTNKWFVDPVDLEQLQREETVKLFRIESPSEGNDWLLTPVYEFGTHQFEASTFTIAAAKKAEWEKEQEKEPLFDPPIDEGDFYSGCCPACGSPSPCGCNYEMERYS